MSQSRRDFLGVSAGVVTSLLSNQLLAADEPSPLIIDTHQHLWDRTRLELPWLKEAEAVLQPDHRPQEYRAATKGLNIRAVYMEVDVAQGQHDKEAEYVIDLCNSGKEATVAAVIGGRPDSPGFVAYLNRHSRSEAVKGVRQVLHGASTPAGHCLSQEFVVGVKELGKRKLSFDLCMRPNELDDGARLAQLCPDTRFIVDHCGNADPNVFAANAKPAGRPSHTPDQWKRSMDKLASRPNTICKISGIVARAPKGWKTELLAPVVNFCLDTFGPDRVVFGSDWPVCLLGAELKQWVTALKEIVADRPKEEQVKLWSGNAIKFYSLKA